MLFRSREDRSAVVGPSGSLRRRLTYWVVAGLLSATALTGGALYVTARQGLLAQSNQDVEVLAQVLAFSGGMTQTFTQQADKFMTDDLASSATLLAEYVALAERSGQTTSQTLQILRRMLSQAPNTEVWITDSQGKAYLHPNADRPFVFSPDPSVQPQGSAFWPLLTGEKKVVNQEVRPRDMDGKLYKYLGVTRVDKPRIVQVGFNGQWIQNVTEQFGIERLTQNLIRAKALNSMYLVGPQLETLTYKGVGLAEDRKSTRLNSSHTDISRTPSSA